MIYLDHAATTPVPEEVAHAVYDTLVSGWGNPSSQYPIGKQARDAVAAARETIAAALGCKSEQLRVGKNDDRESIVTDKSISKSRGVRIIRSFYIITIAGKLFTIIHSFCFLGTVS